MADLLALGQSPIAPDSPAGASIRYDSGFEEVKREIAKLDSVSQEEPDWRRVSEVCEEILEGKSKDLLVATYFTAALFKTRGYRGLEDGFGILSGLLENFWEDLFPELKRMRGRIGALEWLVERLARWVDATAPAASDAEAVKECQARFGTLFEAVRDRLANDAPAMGDLRRAIEKQVAALPKEKVPEAERPAAPAAGAPAAPAAIETPEDARKLLKQTVPALKKAAAVLRKADPKDPLPYRLVRFASWATLADVPPSQNGQTQIPPPRAEVLQAAESLTAKADWATLLELGEGRTADIPFWLDASRHSATALAGLGTGHEAAREAVIAGVGGLVRRLPGLLGLSFQGGTPFADDRTRLWIEGEVLPSLGGGEAEASAGGGAGEDPVESSRREARKLLAGGKFQEAMALFQHGAASAESRRDRFRWRQALASACHDAGQLELAMHQLESLDRESEEYRLDEWEPELSLEVVALLYQCQKKLMKGKASPQAAEAASRTYARLCRIDPVAAMQLK